MTPLAHNIGFDMPRKAHLDWVRYLFECARRWNSLPGGQNQALEIQRMAYAAEKLSATNCPVCKSARTQGQ